MLVYEIVYTKQARRYFVKLPKHLRRRIEQKVAEIAKNPYSSHNNVTKLRNRPGYRLRIGDYRVIYRLEDNKLLLLVLEVGSRGGIYR